MQTAILALAFLGTLTSVPSAAGDELKNLLKVLEKSAVERLDTLVEEGRRAAESSAAVGRVDYSARPSFVIRTTDGRVFQAKALSLAAATDLSVQLSGAVRADFSRLGGADYEVSFTFQKIEPSSSGLAASILAGAANEWLDRNDASKVRTQIRAVLGTALDGSDWVLQLDRTSLRSIELLSPAEPLPPPASPSSPPPIRVEEAATVPPAPRPTPPPPVTPLAAAPAPASSSPSSVLPPDRAAEPRQLLPPAVPVSPSRIPPQVPAPEPVRDPRLIGTLQQIEGSFGSCSLDWSSRPFIGEVVVIQRAGVAIARAQILDRTPAAGSLEILEELGMSHPRSGDRIVLSPP